MKKKDQEKELIFLFGNQDGEDWGNDGRKFEVRVSYDAAEVAFSGGWKRQVPAGRRIFQAYFGAEKTCCGFPVMQSFWEHRDAGKYVKEMGAALAAYLTENAEYMSAYIPERKQYAIARKVLESAGFKVGLSLNSKHNDRARWKNSRWEWFANHLKKVKNEKAVATLTV